MIARDNGESVQNWMCSSCYELRDWFTLKTNCCGARSARAFSNVRCAFCVDDLPGWNLYDDGVTRRCACAIGMTGHLPAQPNPAKRDALGGMLLAFVVNAFVPGVFVLPVRRHLSSSEALP